MKNMTSVMAAILLASAGAANAAQPLSDAQMDNVSAGATAIAGAGSVAIGALIAATGAATSTNTVDNTLATASASSAAIGATIPTIGVAFAASATSATASLP